MQQLKCKVVMLPLFKQVDRKTHTLYVAHAGHLIHTHSSSEYVTPQHLYLVSTRGISKQDYIMFNNQLYYVCADDNTGFMLNNVTTKQDQYINRTHTALKGKVEAATDPSLGLPLIPQSFVEKYVEKQGQINEVLIEMQRKYAGVTINGTESFQGLIVVTRADNTVIIHKVKESWTRAEVKDLVERAVYELSDTLLPVQNVPAWLEENLDD